MEVPGGKDNKAFVCLFEAFGAALLIFAVNETATNSFPPIGIGLALFAGICMFGDVSGAHFNPAVTTAVFIKEGTENMGENFGFMLMIWISQMMGCLLGVLLVAGTQTKMDFNGESKVWPGMATLCPPAVYNEGCAPKDSLIAFKMFVAEMIGTFTLCGVILSQKYKNDAPGTLKAFAVGLTLVCSICMIGGISGGSINPAVALVQTIFQDRMNTGAGIDTSKTGYGSLAVYMLGPWTGGILAGLVSKLSEKALEQPGNKNEGGEPIAQPLMHAYK